MEPPTEKPGKASSETRILFHFTKNRKTGLHEDEKNGYGSQMQVWIPGLPFSGYISWQESSNPEISISVSSKNGGTSSSHCTELLGKLHWDNNFFHIRPDVYYVIVKHKLWLPALEGFLLFPGIHFSWGYPHPTFQPCLTKGCSPVPPISAPLNFLALSLSSDWDSDDTNCPIAQHGFH